MLKKIIVLVCISASISEIKTIGRVLKTTYHTDHDRCKHEVKEGWENKIGWQTDTIIDCPNKKDPKIGSVKRITWDIDVELADRFVRFITPLRPAEQEGILVTFSDCYNKLNELEGKMETSPFFANGNNGEIRYKLINQLVEVRETILNIMKKIEKK